MHPISVLRINAFNASHLNISFVCDGFRLIFVDLRDGLLYAQQHHDDGDGVCLCAFSHRLRFIFDTFKYRAKQ